MGETAREYTRRGFMAATASTYIAVHSGVSMAQQGLGYVGTYLRTIASDSVERPDGYSYDVYEFDENAVLEFDDAHKSGQGNVLEFGDERPPPPTETTTPNTIDLPGVINLPLRINLSSMQQGVSILLIGVMALLLGAAAFLRNMAAGVMWSVSFSLLIISGLFGFGLELYWLSIILTIILLLVGMVVRWGYQ